MADDNIPRSPRYPFTRSNVSTEAPARGPGNDPLSELARLIGQSDPFADPAPPPPSPPSQRTLREILSGARDNQRHDAALPAQPADYRPPPLVPDYRNDPRNDLRADTFRDEPYRGDRRDDPADAFEGQHAQPGPGDFPAHREYADDQTDQPHPTDELRPEIPHFADSEYGQPRQQGPYYGDDGQLLSDELYARLPHDDSESQASPPRRRGGLLTVAAVLGLAVIGTAGAYAYRTFISGAPGFPPLIRADSTPNKIVPAQGEGGSNKQIYDRVGGDGAQGEKIVSREEQPVDVKPAGARSVFGGASTPLNTATPSPANPSAPAWAVPPAGQAAAPASNAARNPANQNEPRKVRTIPIRADQQVGAQTAPPQTQPPAATPAPVASAPAPARTVAAAPPESSPTMTRPATSRATTSGGGPLSLNPRTDSEERAAPAAAPPRALASAAARVAAPAGQGGYVVQVSAQKTQEEAAASFQSIQARYPAVLGNQQMLIRRKEIAGKGTFYGAQVGPFASQAQAAQICDQLKAAGGTCLVQKN